MARFTSSLRGSIVALATPFRADALDEATLARLALRQIERGSAALVVCGSTGEAATMTLAEQVHAVAVVAEAAHGRVPVLAGCTLPGTAACAELAEALVRAGADGLLVAAPPYVRPSQEGIVAHVRALAHAGGAPVMLYDVPGRSGVAIADETVGQLFAAGLIVALKDATADLSRPPRLRALCGEGLAQFTGDDATAAAHLAMGGAGCVSVTANAVPALCVALHRAWDTGDRAGFARLRDLLDPLHRAMFVQSNPIPLKAALVRLDLAEDSLRLPLTRATPATRARVHAELDALVAEEERQASRGRLALVG
jgi:4-hydroxy-tetrahydrodipicolinate synthase